MAPAKYSVLLPTFNERENLPLMVCMLEKVFTDKCVRAAGRDARLRRRCSTALKSDCN